MPPALFTADSLGDVLPPGLRVFVQGCSASSDLLADAVDRAGDRLGTMVATGIQVSGLNRRSWLPNAGARFETFFMTPELAEEGRAVDFLPLCYADISARFDARPPDAALFSLSPPDASGQCSFGPTADFLPDLWPRIPLRIAHINPRLVRTAGPTIAFDSLHAVIEAEEELPTLPADRANRASAAIGATIATLIADRSTIQTGLGQVPGNALRALVHHRDLRIHSGLIGDAVLDLIDAGAIASGDHVTAGVAIGTRRLYDALTASGIVFRPVSFTHDSRVIAAIDRFVTINSANQVDLYGQAYAEARDGVGWVSGPGGASDFARGARLGGGLRIVALPATAGETSRIVAPGEGSGPVSLGRFDIDVVVTEHGAADLRGLGHDERARAIVAIAADAHRENLARAWRNRFAQAQGA